MIGAIIILIYTSIGLSVGATMFCVDKMFAPLKLGTSDMWLYLISHTFLWPVTGGMNIYYTVQDTKHVTNMDMRGIACRCDICKSREGA